MRKLFLLFAAAALAAPADAQVGRFHPAMQERRIVAFAPGLAPAEGRRILAGLGLHVIREIGLIHAAVIEVPIGQLDEARSRLLALPQVRRVDEDIYANWLSEEQLPVMPTVGEALDMMQQGGEWRQSPPQDWPKPDHDQGEIPWGVARVNAPKVWRRTTGAGVTVAVVDTGIDSSHPDLAANFQGGVNIVQPDQPMKDDNGHGTHVAGTIAAALDGKGVVGVAPGASLLGVKVLDADGSGYLSDIIAGIDWAVEHGAWVINMSLGGGGNESFHEAVSNAVARGVTVVCAAGNSGAPKNGQDSSVNYPAKYPEAIAVSASDFSDQLAYFSSRGPEVAFVAPGVDIRSTLPGGEYGSHSGTSMASPHVAGLAALAIALGARGPADVRSALLAAAAPIGSLKPVEEGSGMVDASKLLH